MESTGFPGRIHVSAETAQELKIHGKSHWLTPREDKVEVKGKGEMTTYFVNVSLTRAIGSKSALASSNESDYTTQGEWEDYSSVSVTRRLSGFGGTSLDRRRSGASNRSLVLTEVEV